jgi:hypothetical protein
MFTGKDPTEGINKSLFSPCPRVSQVKDPRLSDKSHSPITTRLPEDLAEVKSSGSLGGRVQDLS